MPPKADPYATKSAWTVDAALILFAVLMIALVIGTSPRLRHASAPTGAKVSHVLATDATSSQALRIAAVSSQDKR